MSNIRPTLFAPGSRGRRKKRPMKTSEIIAREIIHDIAQNGLTEGDALPSEAAMLAHYEVGRASLREALRLLEVNGLVEIRPGAKGGAVVGSASARNLAQTLALFFGMSGATYEDLAQVILYIYPNIAESAARQELTEFQKQTLLASVTQACEVTSATPTDTDHLKDFHYLLSEFSGSNTVARLFADSIGMILTEHVMANQDSTEFHATGAEDHREIAEAILARDPVRAKNAMYDHTKRLIDFYRTKNPGIFSQLIEWR